MFRRLLWNVCFVNGQDALHRLLVAVAPVDAELLASPEFRLDPLDQWAAAAGDEEDTSASSRVRVGTMLW